jgi:hypothetical protein
MKSLKEVTDQIVAVVWHYCQRFSLLLPALYAAAFVRRTTSSTDLHPLLKRILYFLRILSHYISYFICDVQHFFFFFKGVLYNTRILLSYIRFYARTCKRIYRLMTKTHPSMHIIVLKSKTHPSMHIIVLKSKSHIGVVKSRHIDLVKFKTLKSDKI